MVEVKMCVDKSLKDDGDIRLSMVSQLNLALTKMKQIRDDIEKGYSGFLYNSPTTAFKVEDHARN